MTTSNTGDKPFRLACIGGAVNSAVGQAHQVALRMDRKFEVVTGCFSLNSNENIETANTYGVDPERVYENIDQVLDNERDNIDAVLIVTPTDQHAEQVEKCLKQGMFVISEKSLATSSEQIVALQALSPAGNFDVAVVYNYLGYPIVRELKYMIENGRLGKIKQIQIEMPQEGFAKLHQDGAPMVPQAWRLTDSKTVSTVSLDLGVHLHAFVRYLTGLRPLEVVALSHSYGNYSEVIDNVNCLAKYEQDLTCNIWYGKVFLGKRNGLSIRVLGSEGSAEWVQTSPEELLVSDVHGNLSVMDRGSNDAVIASLPRYTRFKIGHPAGFIEAMANFYWDIAELLVARNSGSSLDGFNIYSMDSAYEGLRMLEAIKISSESGKWEKV